MVIPMDETCVDERLASKFSKLSSMISVYLLLAPLLQGAFSSPASFPISFEVPLSVEAGGVHNIRISYKETLDGDLSFHYGSCSAAVATDCHHFIGSTHVGEHPQARQHASLAHDLRPTRFVWLPPSDAPDGMCLHAFSSERLVGRSAPLQMLKKKSRRQSIPIADIADAEGPWFDGVAYLKAKEPGAAFVTQAKSKSVGIIGGGMSGLMTSVSGFLMLQECYG